MLKNKNYFGNMINGELSKVGALANRYSNENQYARKVIILSMIEKELDRAKERLLVAWN